MIAANDVPTGYTIGMLDSSTQTLATVMNLYEKWMGGGREGGEW